MSHRLETALVGLTVLLIGFGMCAFATAGFVEQNVFDLPIGGLEGGARTAQTSPWPAAITGLVLMLLGSLILALCNARPDRVRKRDERSRERRVQVSRRGRSGLLR